MKKSAALAPWLKIILYGACALLWLSGALWLYSSEGQPSRTHLIKIHGAAAMGFLILFGTLLSRHVPAGWNQENRRPTGIFVIATCGVLTLTGWGLYYFVGDSLRHGTSLIHSAIGLLLPAIIFIHVRFNR